MGQSNIKMKQLEWRRSKIQELAVKGFSQAEIGRILQIPKTTISRDVSYLKQSAKQEIKKHITDRLPYEYNKCLHGLEEIIKESWTVAESAEKAGERLQSLSLIKDCYSTKMDLLTNASLLQDSIKFVESKKEKLSNNKKVNNNSNGLEGFTETNRTESAATVF